MRYVLGLFLAAHGAAHLVGFATAWRLSDTLPYHTTLFGGRMDVGESGTQGIGVLWLLAAIGFCVAGVGLAATAAWWRPLALLVAAGSLLLSLAEWPAARIGVAIDLALLTSIALASLAGA